MALHETQLVSFPKACMGQKSLDINIDLCFEHFGILEKLKFDSSG